MTSAVYNNALYHFGIGEIAWVNPTTDIYCLLTTNTAPTKTHAHYSEVSGVEISGGNYVAGGEDLPIATTVHLDTSVAHFESGNTVWSGVSFTTYYAITQHTTTPTTTTNPLITYHDLGEQTVTSGTFTLQWATTGVFTITITGAS